MSGIASNSLRQASRLCLKQPASAAGLLRSSTPARVVGISQRTSRRGYVSATTKDSAQVNVDTAIRADQKAFFAETGKLPENQIIPGTSANADAMMSPMAGMLVKRGRVQFRLTNLQVFSSKLPSWTRGRDQYTWTCKPRLRLTRVC